VANCRACWGKGYSTCPSCKGTGRISMITGSVQCKNCSGSGKVKCGVCKGKGYV